MYVTAILLECIPHSCQSIPRHPAPSVIFVASCPVAMGFCHLPPNEVDSATTPLLRYRPAAAFAPLAAVSARPATVPSCLFAVLALLVAVFARPVLYLPASPLYPPAQRLHQHTPPLYPPALS